MELPTLTFLALRFMRVYASCDRLMATHTHILGTLCVFVNRWSNKSKWPQLLNNNTHKLTVHLSLYVVNHVTKSNSIEEYLVLCAELDSMRRERRERREGGRKRGRKCGEGIEREKDKGRKKKEKDERVKRGNIKSTLSNVLIP